MRFQRLLFVNLKVLTKKLHRHIFKFLYKETKQNTTTKPYKNTKMLRNNLITRQRKLQENMSSSHGPSLDILRAPLNRRQCWYLGK